MDKYEDLKKLFNVKEDTWQLFYTLKYTTQIATNNDDTLYLFRNRISKSRFIDFIKQNKIKYYNSNVGAYWDTFSDKKTYLRTVDEIKKLDGYRFKKIYFVD